MNKLNKACEEPIIENYKVLLKETEEEWNEEKAMGESKDIVGM